MRFLLFATVFLATILATSLAYADDPPVITPIDAGSPAPFSGVLLTPQAVAKIVAESNDCARRIQVESDHARDVQRVTDDKILADARAQADHDRDIADARARSQDGQIDLLTRSLASARADTSNRWLWGALGLTVGSVVAVVVTSFALSR